MRKILLPALIMLFVLACFAPPTPPEVERYPSSPTKPPVITAPVQAGEEAPSEPQPGASQDWCLFWASSYCLAYDPSLWQPQGTSGEPGDLVIVSIPECFISEEGPMGLPQDISLEMVGSIQYTVVDRLTASPAFMGYTAMENRDPASQYAPSFFVYVAMPDNLGCLSAAREVLAGLQMK